MNRHRPDSSFLPSRHPYLWIILTGFLLYAKTLSYGFTYLDDNILVLNNFSFISKLSNICRAFGEKVFFDSFLPYYRPGLVISFILDAQLGGVGPFFYHLTNILIHVTAASLVFRALTKLNYEKELSFLFAIIFTVHPALTQAVAWIPGRNDSLLAVFVLAAFIFFLQFIEKRGVGNYILHLTFFAFAVFVKESAVMLAALSFIYIFLVRKERTFSFKSKALLIGYAFVITAWHILRKRVISGSVEMNVFDMAGYFVTYFPAVIQFIGKAVFPVNLSVFPIMEDTSYIYGLITVILVILGISISKGSRSALISFAALWIILFLAPSFIRPHASIVNDVLQHRFYTSMFGFIIIFMEMDFIKEKYKEKIFLSAAGIVIAIFFMIAFRHSDEFKDRLTFWNNAVKTSPRSPFAHLALGNMYYMDGDIDRAEAEFGKALDLDPRTVRGHYYLGLIYMKKGLLKKAEAEFKKEIVMYPYCDQGYLALGVIYHRQGNFKDAEALWERTLSINQRNADAMRNLAIYYSQAKDFKKSAGYVGRLRAIGVEPPADFLKTIGIE